MDNAIRSTTKQVPTKEQANPPVKKNSDEPEMKLFEVFGVYIDGESYSYLYVGESKESVIQRQTNKDKYDEILTVHAIEITEVDGYRIRLEKI